MIQRALWAARLVAFLVAATAVTAAVARQGGGSGGDVLGDRPAAPFPRGTPSLRYGVPASQGPQGVAWGAGADIQVGAVLAGRYGNADQHTGLYVFDVFLRNVGRHTVTLDCATFGGLSVPSDGTDYLTLITSPYIYCTPHVRDDRGHLVKIGYRLGPERGRFAIGPGEVAEVSHWMLRTMARHPARNTSWSYDQVAFITPGRYRLSCDLAISPKSGAPRTLRTGEVAFDVTPADLGSP